MDDPLLDLKPLYFKLPEFPLPKIHRPARFLQRLYSICGTQVIGRMLKDYLNLPIDCQILPGFSCTSARIRVGCSAALSNTTFIDYAPIFIADRVTFSFDNSIVTSSHILEDFSTVVARPVVLERNVWITTKVTILGGVLIGENSVIGAGSVVTRSVPPNVFAAGNPCKVIRQIKRG